MDKWQAQNSYWSSFGYPAYDASSVPDGEDRPDFPYITYEGVNGMFNDSISSTASIWTRGTTWRTADIIANAIEESLKNGGTVVSYTGGIIWVTPGSILAQNMGDPEDDLIRRKVINVTLHFC